MNKISERIKELRLENNLTQKQLAKLANIRQSAISQWENDERIPTIDNLVTLSKIFNCSCDYLLGLTDY